MIGNSKPLASLSSGLLARKGHARPAMRPQGFAGFGGAPQTLEDLGWNDMGDAPAEPPVTGMTGAATPDLMAGPRGAPAEPPVVAMPPVLHQRALLADELVAGAAAHPVSDVAQQIAHPATAAVPAPPRQTVAARLLGGAKAAFTLRLDADRHLRLRLASALQNRSSQLLVTQALDALLATLPDVEDMARRQSAGGAHDLNKGK